MKMQQNIVADEKHLPYTYLTFPWWCELKFICLGLRRRRAGDPVFLEFRKLLFSWSCWICRFSFQMMYTCINCSSIDDVVNKFMWLQLNAVVHQTISSHSGESAPHSPTSQTAAAAYKPTFTSAPLSLARHTRIQHYTAPASQHTSSTFSKATFWRIKSHKKMREIVHIQAGQCGNQIGAKVSAFYITILFKIWFYQQNIWMMHCRFKMAG